MSSGVDQIRERLFRKGVSEAATHKYKMKNFKVKLQFVLDNVGQLVWQATDYCISMWHNKILDYLAFLFEKDYKYRAIWCYRSAISAFHDYVDRKPVGHQAEVCALFSWDF